MGTTATTSESKANTRPAIFAILAISAAASLFLFWLIYQHPAADAARDRQRECRMPARTVRRSVDGR